MNVNMNVNIDTCDFIYSLTELSEEEVIKFVKKLDEEYASWNISIELFQHFFKMIYQNREILEDYGTTFDDIINSLKEEVDNGTSI